MARRFVDCDRETPFLLPPSVQDWLPENHLARFVVEIVSKLDLSPLVRAYAGRGSKAYHPSMLLSLLFYGYATGVFSSRKLQAATYDSVAFRYVSGNVHPDHDTIAHFRKRFLTELKPLFVQILLIAQEMGLLKLGTVVLDGTKVKANASKHQALSWQYACRLEQQLKDEVEALLALAEKADHEESEQELDLPKELSRREDRLAVLKRAKKEIERRAAERFSKEREEWEAKMEERRRKEEMTGRKSGGPKPKPPPPGPRSRDQVNLTDEESRIMPTSGGGFEQAYNAQAAVDLDSMVIVESHLSQAPNDKQQLTPALAELSDLPEELGSIEAVVADAGYFSRENVEACEQRGIDPYIATGRQQHNRPLAERLESPPILCDLSDPVERMGQRLKTADGRALYAKRKTTIEPTFGVIKSVMGFRQFLLRGFQAVQGEWDLVCLAFDLKRLHGLAMG